jgi:N-methylhydantoinase A
VRVQAVGITDKPVLTAQERMPADPSAALKGRRPAFIPRMQEFLEIPVYDGHQLRHGHLILGPAIIEEATTAVFVDDSFDCLVDRFVSLALYEKGRDDLVAACLQGADS